MALTPITVTLGLLTLRRFTPGSTRLSPGARALSDQVRAGLAQEKPTKQKLTKRLRLVRGRSSLFTVGAAFMFAVSASATAQTIAVQTIAGQTPSEGSALSGEAHSVQTASATIVAQPNAPQTEDAATERRATPAPETDRTATGGTDQDPIVIEDPLGGVDDFGAASFDEPTEALVFSELSDDQVVERLRAYLEGETTTRGKFTQISPSGGVSTGQFYVRRPNRARFEYDAPSPLLIVATQGNVYVQDSELETTDFYPLKRTPLKFLLSKSIDLDEADVVAVERGVNAVAVTFASVDDDAAGELALVFNAPDLSLREWVVRDAQNGETYVSLQDVETDVRLPNALFRAPDAGGAFLRD
ncbi:MAG: outer membrane lipoprotein carrier protein LolA [Pseudomonadota bacterium]